MSHTDHEEWRPVVGFEGAYEVSDHGRVRSLDRWRTQRIARGPDRTRTVTRLLRGQLLTPVKVKSGGYLQVTLSDGSTHRPRKIHQLVTAAFLGECPPGLMPLHGDGDPTNNRLSNLRYGTGADNVADAKGHGTFKIGSARSQAKLDERGAGAIRTLCGAISQSVLAEAFGVSQSAISLIRKGENWPHVQALPMADARRELERRRAG